jgi:uncharacterized Zn-binding protein involved in type VI secretion
VSTDGLDAVKVDGLHIARQGWDSAACFDWHGEQVMIMPGQTILRKGHPFLRVHGHLFEPLVIEPDYDHLVPVG